MKILNPKTIASPGQGYSQGIAANGAVYVAGQVAVAADGKIMGTGDIAVQTRQTLENVRGVLAEGGMALSDIVSATVYIKSLADYPAFAQTWCAVFGEHRPARATVKADLVHPDLLIEIQAIAVR